jgi:hypothetical protein
MNHPNPKSELTKEFVKFNISFSEQIEADLKVGKRNEVKKDLEKCLRYESERTTLYIIHKELPTNLRDPYLSIPLSKRKKIKSKLDDDIQHRDLFTNNLKTPTGEQGWVHKLQHDQDDGSGHNYKLLRSLDLKKELNKPLTNAIESTSVPIVIHMGVDWSKEDFKKSISDSWERLCKERENLIEEYTVAGAIFAKDQNYRGKYRKKLKVLGHFRLFECCKYTLEELLALESSDRSKNEDERVFSDGFIFRNFSQYKKELKFCFPFLYTFVYGDKRRSFNGELAKTMWENEFQ